MSPSRSRVLIASKCKSFGDSRRRTRYDSNAAPVPIARPRPPIVGGTMPRGSNSLTKLTRRDRRDTDPVSAQGKTMRVITDRGLGQQLISSVLTTAALRHADREALYCSGTGRRFTFRELNERSNRLATSFSARGFLEGGVIRVFFPHPAPTVGKYYPLS